MVFGYRCFKTHLKYAMDIQPELTMIDILTVTCHVTPMKKTQPEKKNTNHAD